SSCRMFIGARTHATIAAYSTCVPTLALGYSVKSKGIARDIFGDEKGLVLPIQEITHERQLINYFNQLCERENDLIRYLKAVMPSYIEKTWQAGEEVRKLLEG
ncbi:polysaccharide pyruvyl transferase family protein, partial [Actinomycetota bacterium]